jgi:hypothetical protein
MKFSRDENEVFSGKTIVNSLGKYFTILLMLIEFLMSHPTSLLSMITELEILYKNILRQPLLVGAKWNAMLRFKCVPMKLQHEILAQEEENSGVIINSSPNFAGMRNEEEKSKGRGPKREKYYY